MNPPEAWKSLEIDTAEAPPVPPPGPGRHVVVFMATPTVRSGGWSARAALEIARGWGASGARIVLVDMAFEEPALDRVAGLDQLEGISDALLFGTSFQRMGQPLSDGLYLVTAGTAVPDGEALRSHPRWRDFVEGFRDADAVLALYTPDDAPGVDVLLELADGVIVLCTEDEAGEDRPTGGVPVLGLRGPERVHEEDLGGDPSPVAAEPRAETAAGAEDEVDVEADSSPDFGVEDAPLPDLEPGEEPAHGDTPGDPDSGEPEAFDDPVADFLEEMEVAPVDPAALVSAVDPAEVGVDDAGLEEDETDPFAPAEEADPQAPTLDEILADEGSGAGPADEDDRIPDESGVDPGFGEESGSRTEAPPAARTRSRGSRNGPRPALLALLVVVVLAVLVAAFLGLVEIPGITPSAAGVEEAGATEVVEPRTGEGEPVAPGPAGGESTGDGRAADGPAAGGEAAPPIGAGSPLLPRLLSIGSFRDPGVAGNRAREIEAAAPGARLIIAPVEVDGSPFYRILAGPVEGAADFEGVRRRLSPALGGRVEGLPRIAPLAFLLGTAPTLALARERRDDLIAAGVPAYVFRVTDSGGESRFRVYAGAYANPAEARFMSGLLAENGIGDAPLTERRGVWPE